jgi:hypothetical protein
VKANKLYYNEKHNKPKITNLKIARNGLIFKEAFKMQGKAILGL